MTARRADQLAAMKEKLRVLGGRQAKFQNTDAPVVGLREKQRRSGKKSTQKGGSYERRIASKFSTWSGEVIKRTPRSGGWSHAEAFGVAGDLVCRNKRFPFHVECKKREDWLLTDLITGARPEGERSIVAWWEQAIRDCPVKKTPLLVFSRNFQPDFVMLRMSDMVALEPTGWWEFCARFTVTLDTDIVEILLLDDFLRHVPPTRGLKSHQKKEKSTCQPA